jgi:hypothetical protein
MTTFEAKPSQGRGSSAVPPLPCHPPSYWLKLFSSQTFSLINTSTFSDVVIFHIYPPMKIEQCVPKCQHIKFRSWGITQKKHTTFRTWRKFEIKNSLQMLMNFLRNAPCASGLNILSYLIAVSCSSSTVFPLTDNQAYGKAKNFSPAVG